MSTDLEAAIRNAVKQGRLNHISLAIKWDGTWEAGYRGVATDDHRIVAHSDPVGALIGALTGRKPPDTPKPARKKKSAGERLIGAAQEALTIAKETKPVEQADEFEDLL